tara:strand:+ start:269948 stop:270463 length:516 start_codon:yes stop_codon:yes gene_type:complete
VQFNRVFKSILAITLLVVAACSSEPAHRLVGEKFPIFDVETLDGNPESSMPSIIDKPILFNVWATWCAPCVKELPALESLAKQGYFRVIALSTDADATKVQQFVNKHDLKSIQVLFDSFGRQSRAQLDAQGLPVSFLIDKNGVVKDVFLGERDWMSEVLQARMKKAVGLSY